MVVRTKITISEMLENEGLLTIFGAEETLEIGVPR
jgi:hypothetical protein